MNRTSECLLANTWSNCLKWFKAFSVQLSTMLLNTLPHSWQWSISLVPSPLLWRSLHSKTIGVYLWFRLWRSAHWSLWSVRWAWCSKTTPLEEGYTNMFTDESSICLEINIYLYLAAAICLLHGYHAGMQLPLKSSGMAGSWTSCSSWIKALG